MAMAKTPSHKEFSLTGLNVSVFMTKVLNASAVESIMRQDPAGYGTGFYCKIILLLTK
jgi:hypothetical protein